MLQDRFYDLIESARSRGGAGAASVDPEALGEVLAELSDLEVQEFAVAFDAEIHRMNRWDVWGVGYVAAGGMSDDSFQYFRSWLIGKGQETVDAVLADPDALADRIGEDDELDNEALEYVALDLLEQRGLPDLRTELYEDTTGEPFDEETVQDLYPRTAAAAG